MKPQTIVIYKVKYWWQKYLPDFILRRFFNTSRFFDYTHTVTHNMSMVNKGTCPIELKTSMTYEEFMKFYNSIVEEKEK